MLTLNDSRILSDDSSFDLFLDPVGEISYSHIEVRY